MSTAKETLTKTLSAAVGQGGTITISYPDGKGADDYAGGTEGKIISHSQMPLFQKSGDFTLTFGASNITVTMNKAAAFNSGDTIYLEVDAGEAPYGMAALASGVTALTTLKINLGAPDTADPNGAVETQACTLADGLATGINGALAADDVATFDVPRNVVAAWTGAAILTVTGTDAYGNTIVESSASGTSLAGKKAFKTVTGISVSANVTALTVGTGDVLGLPIFLGDKGDVVKEIEDGDEASAGTIVDGATATATATTGDVRGTYAPNSSCDGSKVFELIVMARDPHYTGVAQYAG